MSLRLERCPCDRGGKAKFARVGRRTGDQNCTGICKRIFTNPNWARVVDMDMAHFPNMERQCSRSDDIYR
jgi:hypothetical protein